MMDLLGRMGALTSGEDGSDWVDAGAGVAAVALAGEKAGARCFQVQEKVRGSAYFCFWTDESTAASGRLHFVSCSCHDGTDGTECVHHLFGWAVRLRLYHAPVEGVRLFLSLHKDVCSDLRTKVRDQCCSIRSDLERRGHLERLRRPRDYTLERRPTSIVQSFNTLTLDSILHGRWLKGKLLCLLNPWPKCRLMPPSRPSLPPSFLPHPEPPTPRHPCSPSSPSSPAPLVSGGRYPTPRRRVRSIRGRAPLSPAFFHPAGPERPAGASICCR